MQAISSLIVLQYPSHKENGVTRSVNYSGTAQCALLNTPFEELLQKRNLPSIARVKDLTGKVFLFDGLAAEIAKTFEYEGFFKIGEKLHPCASIRFFTLQSKADKFYFFVQQSLTSFQYLHGNIRAERVVKLSNERRTLLVLGQTYREWAIRCFQDALHKDPENVFAKESLEQLEAEKEAEVRKKMENLRLEEKAIEEPSPKVEKPKRNECGAILARIFKF